MAIGNMHKTTAPANPPTNNAYRQPTNNFFSIQAASSCYLKYAIIQKNSLNLHWKFQSHHFHQQSYWNLK